MLILRSHAMNESYRRVVFQPYTRQQLETIAKTRLDGLNVFESRAIEYAARKVRQPSSDDLIIDPVQLVVG